MTTTLITDDFEDEPVCDCMHEFLGLLHHTPWCAVEFARRNGDLDEEL